LFQRESIPPASLADSSEVCACGFGVTITDVAWKLGKFRQAIDYSQPYFGSHLHLHHLRGETFTNSVGILQIKLDLSATLLNEVKNKQVREVLQFLVARVRAQVQNLGHREKLQPTVGANHLSPNPLLFYNDPKDLQCGDCYT
jgi:hypothetical protein